MTCEEFNGINDSEGDQNRSSSAAMTRTHEWGILLKYSIRRVHRWQAPPRWTDRDWHDEIRSEIMLAAVLAQETFNVSRGVPWEAYLRQKVVHAALARYRREWSYSLRISQDSEAEIQVGAEEPNASDIARQRILKAVSRLPRGDTSLIDGLYWKSKSEAELAKKLGISQQAVNKRKHAILRQLQRDLNAMDLESDVEN